MPTTRNILIFIAIAIVIFSVYFFFLKPDPMPAPNLTNTADESLPNIGQTTPSASVSPGTPDAAADFLTLLLNVKNIKLEESLFSDPAFKALRDSSIVIASDGTEGRPNPFAPLGRDITTPAVTSTDPDTTEAPDADTTNPDPNLEDLELPE
jgi:hypothetical protein